MSVRPEASRSALADALSFLPVRLVRAALRGLELDRAVAVGAALGAGVARAGGPPCRTARINLRIAFPEASERERQSLLVESYANLGRGVAELALLQGPRRGELLDRVEIDGLEHLTAAATASSSGGLIVLTAHFGSWDLAGAAMARRGQPVTLVHRPFRHPELARMMSGVRRAGDANPEELAMGPSAAGGVMRALAQGRRVALLLDQNARREEGVFVPFFSRLACTRVAPALIALRRRVPVVPALLFRQGSAARHQLRFQPALELPAVGDDLADAVRQSVSAMTRVIEAAIREAPTQWLWSHRRWRTRPLPEDSLAESVPIYPGRSHAWSGLRERLTASTPSDR